MKDFKLEQFPKINSGFKVPEGYFDDFDTKIVIQLPQNEAKVISIFRKPYIWISAVAAIFVVGFFISMFYYNLDNNSLSNEDYLLINENLNTEDLVEHLSENDIQSLENSLTIYDLETTKLAQENL